MIVQNGFTPSQNGRIGSGVYFTVDKEEAARIAKYKFEDEDPVVIECIAKVDFKEFNKDDSEDVLLQKMENWFEFVKDTAKQGIHPPWANNSDFR